MRIPFAALHQILKAIALRQSKNMRDFYATCVQCTGLFTLFSHFHLLGLVKLRGMGNGDRPFDFLYDTPLPRRS
jgi:hypothetical protein